MTLAGKSLSGRLTISRKVGWSLARLMVADAKGGWKLGTGIEFALVVMIFNLETRGTSSQWWRYLTVPRYDRRLVKTSCLRPRDAS
jgi:hypothetical protein